MSPRSRRTTVTAVVAVVLIGGAVLVASKTFAPTSGSVGATSPASPTSSATPRATAVAPPHATASSTPPAATPTAPTSPPEPTSTAATKTRTPLTLSYSGYDAASASVQASGYIDLIETGGTCTLTLTSGGKTASGSHTASADATTTSCGAVEVPRSSLASGTWDGVLSYSSATTVADSTHFSVVIP